MQTNLTHEAATFADALAQRRQLVYDYLDNWPGAEKFQPRDIHDALFSYVRHRGKALRPSLLMLACGAAGGDEIQALPAAGAVEIFQIWTLVHDDIIDRDETRRGGPTVHARYTAHAREEHGLVGAEAAHYGTAVAILAGDLQQSWSYALLSDLLTRGVSPTVVLSLVRKMAESLTPSLLEGEMLDVQFAVSPPETLTDEDVLNMMSKKTSALFEYSAWAGATIGQGDRPDTDDMAGRLGRFASLCGIAFQLHDDLLGLTADEKVLGKPVGSDLREGKRTLLVCRALANLDEESRSDLLRTLGNAGASHDQIKNALSLIDRSGAHEEIRLLANSYLSQALGILESLPHSPYVSLLESWATFTLARKY